MNFRRPEPKLGRVSLAAAQRAGKNILELGIVVHELQQRPAVRPALADAEQILGGGVQVGDQEILIEKDNAGVQDQEILIEKDNAGVQGSKNIARRCAAASGIGWISV